MNSRAPVKKRLPTEADWKLNTEDGRARFTISRLIVFKKERMSSRFSDVMKVQSGCRASTMSSHSFLAEIGSFDGRRWLKRALIAVVSGFWAFSGMRRTSRPVKRTEHAMSRRKRDLDEERVDEHVEYHICS